MKIPKIVSAVSVILLTAPVVLHVDASVTFSNLTALDQTNGAFPDAGLIPGQDGNFYGTATSGGSGGDGTVFRVTSAGTLTNVVDFNGANGAGPRARLTQTPDGKLYGTTYNGGSDNFGTVFEVTTNGTLTTLVTFTNSNGRYPIAGLLQASDGNFYGTTILGGTNNLGTVFKLAANGAFSTLVSFDGTNGASPYADLMEASDGNLYGTTYQGGTNGGYGTIFRLGTNGAFASLFSFQGGDGANPYAALSQGADGNLYGTTFYGGSHNFGTVFEFTTNGLLTTLVSFNNTNGAYPQAGLLRDSDGNFYGTTSHGGAYTNQAGLGYGTLYRMSTNGTLTTLMSFNGMNGAFPKAGLIEPTNGNFYGTAASGGANGFGTVFRLGVISLAPKFLTTGKTGSTLTLTWSATVGHDYQMLYTTNLTQPAWTNLNGSLTATNSVMTTLDTNGTDRQRFYRILALP